MDNPTPDERRQQLIRLMNTIQWDIRMLRNEEILKRKQAQLQKMRTELESLGPQAETRWR